MRLAGIKTIEEANKYLNEYYLPEVYNKKFTVKPESDESAFVPTLPSLNLDDHFYRSERRKVRNDHTVSLKGEILDLEKTDDNIVGQEIELRFYPNESIRIFWNDRELFFKEKILKAS